MSFNPGALISRSLWIIFAGPWGAWTHATLPVDDRLDMPDRGNITGLHDLVRSLISTPLCHGDEKATAELGGEALGLASLKFGHDEVELDTFGLVPGQVSKGLGGAFLTLAARLAWQEAPAARRLWLHTSSSGHPHALGNYLRRRFHVYKTAGPAGR